VLDRGVAATATGILQGVVAPGGTFPALIFHQYMAGALAGAPVLDLPGPPGPSSAAGRAGRGLGGGPRR
jgi:hypothetical protein